MEKIKDMSRDPKILMYEIKKRKRDIIFWTSIIIVILLIFIFISSKDFSFFFSIIKFSTNLCIYDNIIKSNKPSKL